MVEVCKICNAFFVHPGIETYIKEGREVAMCTDCAREAARSS